MTVEKAARNGGIRHSRCVLFAYHEMGYECMRELIAMGAPIVALFTHQDSPGEEVWWRSCAVLAADASIPVFTPEKLTQEWTDRITAASPDVIYSFYYRNLLPEAVLRIPRLGAYNVHGSLLPKYRGRAPVNWMIANGEREGGATLHHMVARADAGDIVAQRRIEIVDEDTALTLYRKIVPLGAALIREYHPLIVAGEAPRHPQNLNQGSYFGRRRPEDGRIDWNWPALRIVNLVRAVTHPYPGAFCFLKGRKVFVWEARIASETGRAQAGQISAADANGIEVMAGEGRVLLTKIQFEGEAERPAREFAASLSTMAGVCFQ